MKAVLWLGLFVCVFMNSWVVLLSATLRLVDLHDSNHDRHCDSTSVSTETRPGQGDGYWLDIACLLLEYLLEQDYQTNGQFIPQARCLNHLEAIVPELTADDLTYVVNMLSTPSELFFKQHRVADSPLIASTKQTALLEKQSKIGHVRLSQAGRQSVTLSRQVDDILYSEHDAAKIISAIARSDFDKIPGICDSILLSIRGLTQDIRRIRENPALEGKLTSFQGKRKHYQTAMGNIQATVRDCQNQFRRKEIRDRFDQWVSKQQEAWDLQMINHSLTRILSALENLNRRLTDLLQDIAQGRIQSMGVVDFNKAALSLAERSPSAELMDSVFSQLAPVELTVNIPAPGDYLNLLDNRKADTSPKNLVYDSASNETQESLLLQRFLHHFGQPMRDKLQQGPLSLDEAITQGWYQLKNDHDEMEDCLPQLINMFVDTEQLTSGLEVAVGGGQLDRILPDGRRLRGDNPILILSESEYLVLPA